MSGQLQNYLSAESPKLVAVLKLPLLPLSIGHLILLEQCGNPFLDPSESITSTIFCLPRLIEAAIICSHSYERARWLNYNPVLPLTTSIWRWRIRKCDTIKEAQIFKEYIREGLREPIIRPGNGRIPGTPWYLQLKQFLMLIEGKSESEALNFSYRKAVVEYFAHYELQGQCEVRNSQELASAASITTEEELVKKWREKNPGKVISPEAWISGEWRKEVSHV